LALPAAAVLAALGSPAAVAQDSISFPYLSRTDTAPTGYRDVAHRIARAYVMVTLLARGDPVTGDGGGDLHTGSGIVVDRDGHILTAAHIARGRNFDIRLTFRDGQTARGRVVAVDPRQEVALLKGPRLNGMLPLPLANSPPPKGAWLMAMGSPGKRWAVATLGRVRVPDIGERLQYGAWGFDHAIEVGMEVRSGHSGGPVVDLQGRLVGMVASYELGDTTKPVYVSPRITYVVPAKTLADFLASHGIR
jgi:S1-C subfamily serine protease